MCTKGVIKCKNSGGSGIGSTWPITMVNSSIDKNVVI